MKTKTLLIFALSMCFFQYAQAQRSRISFDNDWQFHLGDIAIKQAVKASMQGGLTDAKVKRAEGEETIIAYTDRNKVAEYKPADWQNITLPHDWLVETAPVNDPNIGSQPGCNGFHPTGTGFYRKEFDIPESDLGAKISIEFDGIFRNSTVWLNGQLLGHHSSGYTPSNYDLTDNLRYGKEGKNVLLVKVDATDYEGWWYEGCGIYRHTWLIKTDRTHIDRFGTYITTPKISMTSALINTETAILNENDSPEQLKLTTKVYSPKGLLLQTCVHDTILAGNSKVFLNQQLLVSNPLLWSPDSPSLYRAVSEISVDGKTVDNEITPFGIRTVEVRLDGFYLNGKRYPIKGTANHQDHAGVGTAIPDLLNLYRLRLLKEMGSNGYRCAHNPPTPQLLDMCDSIGMLVLDENRHLWSTEEGIEDLQTLIRRDRNHPSVFMWSLENEENLQGTEMGKRIIHKLVQVAHEQDPSRQVTAAMNHGWNDNEYSDQLDVVGYNYGQRGMQYVKDKKAYPDRKMLVTESTSYVATRGEFEDNAEKGYMSNFGKGVSWGLQPGEDWKHIADYPYLSGTFVWTGFDYRGEPTPYGWPCVSSHFGIMDVCGFPKDGYYAYKAAWTSQPIVHVFPHWNLKGKEGQNIKMGVYTNCEETELLINNKSLGRRKTTPYIREEWNAIYVPGKIEVRGYNHGKLAAREIYETTGEPARIAMSDNTNIIRANGTDVVIVNVSVLDKKGRTVPTASNKITFTISGPGRIIGTGNGDPSCHDPEKANWRKAFNGLCQVIIQSTTEPGIIRLNAHAADLQDSNIMVQVK